MTRTELTETDDAEIVTRYRMGYSVRELGLRFGVHDSAIRRSLARSGEPRRAPRSNWMDKRRDDVDDAEIVDLRGQGYTWDEIADAVGMSVGGVRRRYQSAVSVPGMTTTQNDGTPVE